MPPEPLPPKVLADFDQALSASHELVNNLIDGYRHERIEAEEMGLTREHAIGALMYALVSESSMEMVCAGLAAAVVRLAEQ